MNRGKIVILSGPSGSGKTTLHQKLLSSPAFKKTLVKSLSATTRAARQGEKNGRDYLFLTKKEFLTKRERGQFLESMQVFDNFYGTPKDKVDAALEKGKNVLLCIDVQGAAFVSKQRKDVIKIFIKTPTLKDLRKRLQKRGTENAQSLDLRLKIAKDELKQASAYNYVVVNDSLSRAYRQLAQILKKEFLKSSVKLEVPAKATPRKQF